MPTPSEKYNHIISYVKIMRVRQMIKPTSGFKAESSCFMGNEFYNLLWFQLITTPEGDFGWLELKNPEVLDGVYQEVIREEKEATAKERSQN